MQLFVRGEVSSPEKCYACKNTEKLSKIVQWYKKAKLTKLMCPRHLVAGYKKFQEELRELKKGSKDG